MNLSKYHETFFGILIFLNYFVYIITFLGLYNFNPKFLEDFHFYFQLYICAFLIIHFFPFRKVKFEHVDRRIAFSSGLIIFTTVILNQLPVAQNALQKIKNAKNKVFGINDNDDDRVRNSSRHTTPYTTPYDVTNTIPYPTQTLGY